MFSGGSSNYKNALLRLYHQVKNTNIFDLILPYMENDLINDNDFWKTNSNFILKNTRGYGYWLWKPYLILKTLKEMNDDDILFYLDIGCEVDIRKKDQIMKLFELVKQDLIIGSFTHNDIQWCKGDLIHRLEIKNPAMLFSPQHQASTIIIKKCQKTVDLVSEWYKIATEDNYHYLNDSPSIKPNLRGFIEHRHDQSIFSLLTKKYNIYSKHSIESGIDIIRNRNGKSLLKGNFSNMNDQKIYKTNYIFESTSKFISISKTPTT